MAISLCVHIWETALDLGAKYVSHRVCGFDNATEVGPRLDGGTTADGLLPTTGSSPRRKGWMGLADVNFAKGKHSTSLSLISLSTLEVVVFFCLPSLWPLAIF